MEHLDLVFQGMLAISAFFIVLSGIIKVFLIPIERDISLLKSGQEKLENRLDKLENRLDNVENRLDKLENRLDKLERRLDKLETDISEIKTLLLKKAL